MGDINTYPDGEEENYDAASLLLDNPKVNSMVHPMSQGGVVISPAARFNTLSDLRVDYVLPPRERGQPFSGRDLVRGHLDCRKSPNKLRITRWSG